MEEILNQLLTIDDTAKGMIFNIENEIGKEITKQQKKIVKQKQEQIETRKKELEENLETRKIEITKEEQEKIIGLEKIYTKKKEQYLEEMYQNIIGRKVKEC